jgi:hypothetical protein
MDKWLSPAGGRTPRLALPAPSPFVLEAGGGSHCKAFGRAVTGFPRTRLQHGATEEEVFRKALGGLKTYMILLQDSVRGVLNFINHQFINHQFGFL